MNDNPDFSSYIAAGQRQAQEKARADEERRKVQDAERRRAEAVILDTLDNVIHPQLEAACRSLIAAGVTAEVGNGSDSKGHTRRSLRIVLDDSPVLVFTAMLVPPEPYVSTHGEHSNRQFTGNATEIKDLTAENFTKIIGEFIQKTLGGK